MPRSCYLGGMQNTPPLPMEIASGILLAVVIVWVFRIGVSLYHKGQYVPAFLALVNCALFGGGLILAGLGVVSW